MGFAQPSAARARRVLVPAAIAPRAPALGGRVHALAGRTMGTAWSLRLVAAPGMRRAPVAAAVQRELDRIVAQMSTWEPDSDLVRFNRAPPGRWQTLPEAFFEVLRCALEIARDSEGAFDPGAGALVDAWGFGPAARFDAAGFVPPAEPQVARAHAASAGWQALELDAANRRVRRHGTLRLDLSAIAKGYAVDHVAALLEREFGLEDTLVEIGGELQGRGVKPDGQPWWVALASPSDDDARADAPPPTWIALHGLAVATSGDDRRFFFDGGRRRPHTIDPRSGRPVAHGLAAVTVLDASCMRADALSTAITVLGPDAGFEFACRRGIAARLVRRDDVHGGFAERLSPAFAALIA